MNSTNANWKDIARLRETIQTAEAIIIGAGADFPLPPVFPIPAGVLRRTFQILLQNMAFQICILPVSIPTKP